MDSGIDLRGQVALVTGAGRGIGRAIASALAAAGAEVAVLSRSADQVAETVALIRDAGGQALALAGDVTDRETINASVQAVQDRFGRIDLLVNDFVYRAVNDRTVVVFEGHAKRNYIHVRDVARAFLHGIENFSSMRGQAYNVGLSDANLSKLELCARIKGHLPQFVYLEAPVGEDPDKRDYIVSNEKIEALGFKPAFPLDAGIVELVKGYTMLRNNLYGNV